MAKIKFGMMMTDARGKLGGQVFSKNRAGAYVRSKVTPVNPRTASQMASRAILAQLSIGWSALTNNQRASWNGAVENWQSTDIFGDIKKPTGKNLYVSLNKNLLQSGQNEVTTVPLKQEFGNLSEMTVEVSIGAGTFELTNIPVLTSGRYQIMCTPQLPAGVSFFKNRLRVIDYTLDPIVSALDIYNNYVAKFGALVLGANLYVQIREIGANGQAGVPFAVKASVVA